MNSTNSAKNVGQRSRSQKCIDEFSKVTGCQGIYNKILVGVCIYILFYMYMSDPVWIKENLK